MEMALQTKRRLFVVSQMVNFIIKHLCSEHWRSHLCFILKKINGITLLYENMLFLSLDDYFTQNHVLGFVEFF